MSRLRLVRLRNLRTGACCWASVRDARQVLLRGRPDVCPRYQVLDVRRRGENYARRVEA